MAGFGDLALGGVEVGLGFSGGDEGGDECRTMDVLNVRNDDHGHRQIALEPATISPGLGRLIMVSLKMCFSGAGL